MGNTELQYRIQELFDELILANETIPIIVEGKNDELALRRLGVMGVIHKLNTGQSILDFCEDLANKHREIITLTDWDRKGAQLFKRINQNLIHAGVKPVTRFWLEFKKLCSKDIQNVEFLVKYSAEPASSPEPRG